MIVLGYVGDMRACGLSDCRAIKNGKGLHSKKEVPIHRVADISGVGIFLCT